MNICPYLFLFATLVASGYFPESVARAAPLNDEDKKPNVLLIIIDDMGWKDIGCAGSTYYDTPSIDKLASEGMRFTNAYSAAPVCTPARGAIFSGKCPARTHLTTVFNGPAGPDDRLHQKSKYRGEKDQFLEARHRHALPKSEVILPQALAEGGYQTGFFGKWHCGECPGYYPDDRGFHVAKGYRRVHGLKYGHFGNLWPRGNFSNLADPQPNDFVPDTLTEECIDFIKNNRTRPFVAVLSHYIVHSPITPKPDKVAKYRDRKATDQNNPEYAALVESVDDSVARVLKCIDELELEQSTLVIFTSDNGGRTPRNTSNYPYMGGKSFPFEAGMKVPLIVKWPGKIEPGISDERVIGMDIYPTMLEASGLPLRPQQHIDGRSFLPATRQADLESRPLVFHFPHYTHATGPFSSIISDGWKLIRFYNDNRSAVLLYDLSIDPHEQNDLSATDPARRKKLLAKLNKLLLEMKAEMPIINPDYTPNEEEKDLRFTKDLAEKEHALFKSRLSR